jgi:8-amino-7-oxononanoate synthase
LSGAGGEFARLACSALQSRQERGLLRQLATVRPLDATHVEIDGRKLVNFSSNNYLGLSHHPRLADAVGSAVRAAGFGSGAAALISGHTEVHRSAEIALAKWKQTEAAVLLPSGYQANCAAVQTIAAIAREGGRQARFLVDKLVHASILDAVTASESPMRVFPHNHLPKLRRLLQGGGEFLDVVATESIFSMDGDAADLPGLAALKKEFPFVFLLDEAHASGVYGPEGAGLAHALGLQEAVDVSIVTLSKALGGAGGAICATRAFCDAVINFGRAFIFTTNVPAAAAVAAEAALRVLHEEPQRRERLAELSRRVRAELGTAGVTIPQGDSPIICCILGTEEAALAASEELRREGLLVGAVRPPTVAPGSSRLRATLCSQHTDAEVDQLITAVQKIYSRRTTSRGSVQRGGQSG